MRGPADRNGGQSRVTSATPSMTERMSVFKALSDVAAALRTTTGNDLKYRMVASRALLRAGVNLLDPRPDQARDPAAIAKVLSALKDMGYGL